MPETRVHPFFGSVNISTGLWEWKDYIINSRRVQLTLWDAEWDDLNLLQEFIENFDINEKKCYEYLKKNHDSIVGLAYSAWSKTETFMMFELFDFTPYEKITPEMTWAVIKFDSVDFFRDDGAISIKVDYTFRDVICNYLISFEFDEEQEIILASIES